MRIMAFLRHAMVWLARYLQGSALAARSSSTSGTARIAAGTGGVAATYVPLAIVAEVASAQKVEQEVGLLQGALDEEDGGLEKQEAIMVTGEKAEGDAAAQHVRPAEDEAAAQDEPPQQNQQRHLLRGGTECGALRPEAAGEETAEAQPQESLAEGGEGMKDAAAAAEFFASRGKKAAAAADRNTRTRSGALRIASAREMLLMSRKPGARRGPYKYDEELAAQRRKHGDKVEDLLMGCVLPCGELAATADMGVPRESADEDVEEELVIALPEGLGCLYTRTRRRRDEGLPLDLLALSVLLATGVLCGLGGVSELSLLGRLLVRLQEWAAALRFLTETLPQLRQNTANSCSGGSSAGVSAGSPECLPSVSLSALQILLTEARPCPRIRVPCSLAAERLLRKGWQLQQQMIAALVHAEDDAAEQLKCYERLQQAQQRRDRLVQLKQQLGGMRGVSAAENPTLSEEELQQAEAAVAAAQTAHATAEAAVMNSNQQLLDLEQQLHSSGIGGLQYESLFHELVAACAWQREAEALAACIEMESESTAKQHQQASNTLNTHRVLHPAYRNTAHLWRMVQVYEPLRQKCNSRIKAQQELQLEEQQQKHELPAHQEGATYPHPQQQHQQGPGASTVDVEKLQRAPLAACSKRFLVVGSPILAVLRSTLDRVLQFERRVRDLQVVGPLPQLTLTEGGTQAASVMLPAARGPVALLQQNPQQQDQVQRQRLSWELWLSLVDEANKLGLGIEAANLVKQLHARALVLQQKVQEAVSGQPIPSLEAAQAMVNI
ncbi:hypothetical protein cyc_08768 [Cyclospora cayetanensis]|uniref:Uncharacterized protein n=1 Tax=Cyclospora cayetanensis TaxID=88456 RepID=A0A1D3CT60_9EIME|nr:hypothetical protein cyc_08768 [Cyclospora cayetanensis]